MSLLTVAESTAIHVIRSLAYSFEQADNQDFMKVLKKRLETAAGEEQLRFFKMRLLTASVLMAVDNSLKAVVDALEDEGMLANTVLFVNSDNGGHPVYTQGHPGNNYPLRSSKFAYYEGGVRVPAFVFAPGHIPSARKGTAYHGLMHHVDLLTTFYSLGGGDVATLKSSAVGSDLDGEDHWPALLGGTTSPRNELVLNLPRSTTWKLGENKTDEGVALRVGKYKMLLNHPYDYWFSPNPGEDHNEASSMMASQCMYSWYTVETDSHTCNMTNFLFDVHADPQELTNLWGDSSYDAIRSSLIKRAETLVGTVELDYGRIMYQKNRVDTSASDTAWKAHNWFAVPWQCAVIE
jgi:arylsulfatase A-like enzyme